VFNDGDYHDMSSGRCYHRCFLLLLLLLLLVCWWCCDDVAVML